MHNTPLYIILLLPEAATFSNPDTHVPVCLFFVGLLYLDILSSPLSTICLSSILFFASHYTRNKDFGDGQDTILTLKETTKVEIAL